ncbi:hydroxymethylpyrimidine/phosphomethylpyrimidine kinase / thiaminase, partial [Tremellales sp. Uapishka_1]
MSKSRLTLTPREQPHVLTIAGSDSGGGAGIQADLKTIAAHGCYGSSVITALTAQNTLGVQGVHQVPTDFVVQQLDSLFSDIPPTVLKFGMVTTAETIRSMSTYLSSLPAAAKPRIVLDPVMVSTSGHVLLPPTSISALTNDLIPLADMITPNIPEAIQLSSYQGKVESLKELLDLGSVLRKDYSIPSVLLKGGHLTVSRREVGELAADVSVFWDEGEDELDTVEILRFFRNFVGVKEADELVVDVLLENGKRPVLFVARKVESRSTHGTGCTLSAAIACAWATGAESNVVAVRQAIAYTQGAIASAISMGGGHGPLNHSHLTMPRALPPPTISNPHPFTSHLIASNLPLWKSYVRHPFVIQLGKGALPVESFKHYIKQDYHYLRHYARAHALGAYKSSNFADIISFSEIALHCARESQMHVSYCETFGVTLADLLATPESAPASAYARYILDIGTQGDVLDLYVAVASCAIGYAEVGLWLQKQVSLGQATMEGNIYKRWMEDYSGAEYLAAILTTIDNLEDRIARDPPSPEKLKRLTEIWHECVRLERDFWQMGLDLS